MLRKPMKSKTRPGPPPLQALRVPLALLGAAILLCGGGLLASYFLSTPRLDDLAPLYALGHQLRSGQGRSEVMQLVAQYAPDVARSSGGDRSLFLIVPYAFGRRCVLELTFEQHRLTSARTSRAVGSSDPCPGSPPASF